MNESRLTEAEGLNIYGRYIKSKMSWRSHGHSNISLVENLMSAYFLFSSFL